MQVDRQKLTNDIKEMVGLSQQDLKDLQKSDHFETQVYESTELDPEKIVPYLVPVTSEDKIWDDWLSISEHVASFQFRRSPGRNCYFLVKNQDDKNLGILDIGADFLSLGPRDEYIGWTMDQRQLYNRKIGNISICVPTRSFGYNLSGGKLLALLAISDQVGDFWKKRYGDTLAGVTVTSLYGKGTQYNRLKHFNYLGKTQGQGTFQIPDEIYRQLRLVVEEEEGDIPGGRFTKGKNSRINIIRRGCKHLGIDASDLTTHNQQRGIYWADRGSNVKEFLTGKETEFKPYDLNIESLVKYWRETWAHRRLENLKQRNELQIKKSFF
jgi:hypothetical protein